MDFPCIQCGLCCKSLLNIPAACDLHNADGCCKHLEGNLCGIYANRPLVCNVEKMYQEYFKDFMTEDEFIIMNLKSCIGIALAHNEQDIADQLLILIKAMPSVTNCAYEHSETGSNPHCLKQ